MAGGMRATISDDSLGRQRKFIPFWPKTTARHNSGGVGVTVGVLVAVGVFVAVDVTVGV